MGKNHEAEVDRQWQDIAEYQRGQQGVETGSVHNQMGLSDRVPDRVWEDNKKKSVTGKSAKSKHSAHISASDDSYNGWFALIVFIAISVYLYTPEAENGLTAIFIGLVVGVIAGRLWKLIIGTIVLLGILLAFDTTAPFVEEILSLSGITG